MRDQRFMYRNLGLKEIQDLLVFLSDEIVTNYDVIARTYQSVDQDEPAAHTTTPQSDE